MSIRIDERERLLTLSVGDLVAEEAVGSLAPDTPAVRARMALGHRLHLAHQETQAKSIFEYQREVAVVFETEQDGYRVRIEGRADGLYRRDRGWVVEEVKSVPLPHDRLGECSPRRMEVYAWQARFYCLFLEARGHAPIKGRVVLVSADGRGRRETAAGYSRDATLAFLRVRLGEILARHAIRRARGEKKRAWATAMAFPFPSPRRGQEALVAAVDETLASRGRLLLSAPSGIGKTAGVLFPALRHALREGLRVLFATAKNTQQAIAVETLRLLTPESAGVSVLVLRAKERMCANDRVLCHEDFCPYARDYHTKVADLDLLRKARALGPLLEPDALFAAARSWNVCPFELSLDLLAETDVVVCDYNYVFDPRVALRRLFAGGPYDDVVLIIDEAHNLLGRARDTWSPSLDRRLLREAVAAVKGARSPFATGLRAFVREIEAEIARLGAACAASAPTAAWHVVRFDPGFLSAAGERADLLLQEHDQSRRAPGTADDDDNALAFLRHMVSFAQVAALPGEEFSHLYECTRARTAMRVLCKDPGPQLKKTLRGFHSVVAMSATLEPLSYYRDVLGFPAKKTRLLSLPSPFPRERRLVVVDPAVPTTFRTRDDGFLPAAERIAQVVSARPGNYLAFFPSFDYLARVAPLIYLPEAAEIIVQQRTMSEDERRRALDRLRTADGGTRLLLAVMGGLFSEGVDYAGEMCVGVIIVGPGLPKVSFEQQLIREHYEQTLGRGFDYAYLYPGMSRVIQAAGRLIRSPDDRGVVVLLAERFARGEYAALFPRDWYGETPGELVCRDVGQRVREFWRTAEPTPRAAAPIPGAGG